MITSNSGASEHAAQHLAADIGGAGFVVGQDAARSRQDRDAEPAIDARQVHELRINAAAGLRDARNQAVVAAPASKMRANVLDVLKREGYIRGFTREQVRPGIAELKIENVGDRKSTRLNSSHRT